MGQLKTAGHIAPRGKRYQSAFPWPTTREALMSRTEAYETDQLLECGYGRMFGPGNAQLPTPNMLMLDRVAKIADSGGAYGKGRVYEQGAHVGNTSMTQVTVGFQLGGQAYSQIIFFEDKRAFDEFTSGNFEFVAQATAVAITAGPMDTQTIEISVR